MTSNLLLCLALIPTEGPDLVQRPTYPSPYFPANMFLVHALTYTDGTCKITHVYVGPTGLGGNSFYLKRSRPQWGPGMPYSYSGPLEKGMKGIWWITRDDPALRLAPVRQKKTTEVQEPWFVRTGDERIRYRPIPQASLRDEYGAEDFPYLWTQRPYKAAGRLRGDEEDYQQGLALAETIASVWQAKTDDDRKALLKKLAAGDNVPAAGWAINRLANANADADVQQLFHKLADNEQLSLLSMRTLSQTLDRVDRENWRKSEARQRLRARWDAAHKKR